MKFLCVYVSVISSSFGVLDLTVRFLIHLELIWGMGWNIKDLVSLIPVDTQFSQSHLLTMLSFPYSILLASLPKVWRLPLQGHIYESFILLHCSAYLVLCQNRVVFITMALCQHLKSGTVLPPAVYFLLRTALPVCVLLCFRMNLTVSFYYFFEEWNECFSWDFIESVDCLW